MMRPYQYCFCIVLTCCTATAMESNPPELPDQTTLSQEEQELRALLIELGRQISPRRRSAHAAPAQLVGIRDDDQSSPAALESPPCRRRLTEQRMRRAYSDYERARMGQEQSTDSPSPQREVTPTYRMAARSQENLLLLKRALSKSGSKPDLFALDETTDAVNHDQEGWPGRMPSPEQAVGEPEELEGRVLTPEAMTGDNSDEDIEEQD